MLICSEMQPRYYLALYGPKTNVSQKNIQALLIKVFLIFTSYLQD